MSEIELVLTDFDGTVVEFGKHVVSDRVREAVIACENKGVKMVPVTGRYYEMAVSVLELLGFDGLGIFDNGATIQNCQTGEIVWSNWLEPELVKRVAKILAPAVSIIDYTPDHNEHAPADNEPERIELVDMPTSHVFGHVAVEKLADIKKELDQIPEITYYTAASTYDDTRYIGVQVNLKDADKFHGVNALRNIMGIPKENTLAIGDGDNDISLFENAALKVAMGNASEGLKRRADYVVGPVGTDGFVEAMEKFVL